MSISDGTVSVGTRTLSAEDGTVFGAAGVGEEGALSISDGTVPVGTRALSVEDGTAFGAAGVAVEGANTLGVPDGTGAYLLRLLSTRKRRQSKCQNGGQNHEKSRPHSRLLITSSKRVAG